MVWPAPLSPTSATRSPGAQEQVQAVQHRGLAAGIREGHGLKADALPRGHRKGRRHAAAQRVGQGEELADVSHIGDPVCWSRTPKATRCIAPRKVPTPPKRATNPPVAIRWSARPCASRNAVAMVTARDSAVEGSSEAAWRRFSRSIPDRSVFRRQRQRSESAPCRSPDILVLAPAGGHAVHVADPAPLLRLAIGEGHPAAVGLTRVQGLGDEHGEQGRREPRSDGPEEQGHGHGGDEALQQGRGRCRTGGWPCARGPRSS